MKNVKKLLEYYTEAKGDKMYYSKKDFLSDIKDFINRIKKENIIASVNVSRSGMTRRLNTNKDNLILNIFYNKKYSYEPVKINGCGMDMLWYLLYSTCQNIFTEKELKKYSINSKCTRYRIL